MKVRTEINKIESKKKKPIEKINETTAGSLRRSVFLECLLWARHCSVTGDTTVNTTHKNPRDIPSVGPLRHCSFYLECSPQIIYLSHFPTLFFSKELTIF